MIWLHTAASPRCIAELDSYLWYAVCCGVCVMEEPVFMPMHVCSVPSQFEAKILHTDGKAVLDARTDVSKVRIHWGDVKLLRCKTMPLRNNHMHQTSACGTGEGHQQPFVGR